MKQYQHILIPIDFSDVSDKTIKQGLTFQKNNHAKLTIINYIEPLPATCSGDIVYEIEETMEKTAQQKMTDFTKHLQLENTSLRIEMGHAKTCIPVIAQEIDADLIVIGSHGHHRKIGSLLLGSTTARVVNAAACDVFIIHP